MYARSTTVRGNPQSIDDAIAYLRDEVMPAVQAMDGCIGLSMMCDRDSGRCIATTRLGDRGGDAQQRVAACTTCGMRYAEMLGGRPEVQEWEIAVLHRMHHGPGGRLLPGHLEPRRPRDDVERVLDAFRMTMLPRHGGAARLLQRQHAGRPRDRARRRRRWSTRAATR